MTHTTQAREKYSVRAATFFAASLITLGAFVLFFGSALSAHAALSTSKGSVIEITDSAALFLIQFTAGSENGDLLIPAATLRSTDDALDTEHLHYYIEDKTGDVIEVGTTTALLLGSNVVFEDEHYRVKEGEAAVFTLLVLFVTEEEDPAFLARMRTLPFHIEGHLMNQQYNRHELGKFTSESAALNVD